ncbi:aromatic ring-hydroxylating dioxygenase subunit alpha [Rhodobacteraceae bacterium NNCM2]|nr:aromatic ring-hydroxylating dioxygenase subunit alpha [Coraliihabitans acroporae]
MADQSPPPAGFNGLARAEPSLPVAWYTDPDHFAREIEEIWRKGWIFFCRADDVAGPLAWHAATAAGRNIVVARQRGGALAAFHNVCRHRGAEICPAGQGRLDRPLLVCPYHRWSYDLTGRLIATGTARKVAGFDRAEHGLIPVGVAEWGGLVFVNLAGGGQAEFEAAMGAELAPLANWPLATLKVAHRDVIEIACNWKVFWENFNECLHCPGIHPDLCELVPIYGRSIMVRQDDPDWQAQQGRTDPAWTGKLREGAESWTEGGRAAAPPLDGLSAEDIARGHTYAVALPSVFVVGHVDYVRSVRVMPLGPERTELSVDWLLPEGRLGDPAVDLDRMVRFAAKVLAEDAAACEMNQRGLTAAPFASGTLMQEEYEVHAFQHWVRAQLGEAERPAASRASRRG